MNRQNILINPSLTSGHSASIEALLHSLLSSGLPDKATDVYCGRNRVMRLTVADQLLSPLNIKQFRRPHLLNAFVYGHLRQSKAERSFRNALTLLAEGFHTPLPLGVAERFEGLRLGLSYYICRHMELPTLREVERSEHWPEIMEALGEEMARLHRKGIFFRDFSPGNILVESTPEGYRFYYIDLNRMDFGVTSRDKMMDMFRAVIYFDPAMIALAESYARAMGLDQKATAEEALKRRNEFEAYLTRKRALKARLKSRK